MSFREKSAWISFVTLLVVCVGYMWDFGQVLTGRASHGTAFRTSLWLIATFVAVEVISHVVLAFQVPDEARLPRDERERMIDMKASQIAFPVLLVGALLSVAVMHLTTKGWVIAHAVLLAIVVAAIVRFGGQVFYYRRGV